MKKEGLKSTIGNQNLLKVRNYKITEPNRTFLVQSCNALHREKRIKALKQGSILE
jgi:hypothetical protein